MYIIKIYTLALMTYGYGYTVDRATLDFGTPDNSHCGFCKTPCNGKLRGGELQQDIICDYCSEAWYLDDDDNAFYIRNNSHQAALFIESLVYAKSYKGFRHIPLLEWYFYYDNDQLRSDIVRCNWVRSKYRYWDYESPVQEDTNQNVNRFLSYDELTYYNNLRSQATIRTDIDEIINGTTFFHGNLQCPINSLFNMMSALTMAVACSQNREYLIEALESSIIKCESYYSNHIPLFSNIISMARELLNSERQSGWIDRW